VIGAVCSDWSGIRLAKRGAKVTLVHVMDRLMERQLDGAGGALLAVSLRKRRARAVERQRDANSWTGAVENLEFHNGTMLEAMRCLRRRVKPMSISRARGVGLTEAYSWTTVLQRILMAFSRLANASSIAASVMTGRARL